MTDITAIARRLYADLAKTVTRSLPTGVVMERYDLWGDRLEAVIATSNGYLHIRAPGIVEAVGQESRP